MPKFFFPGGSSVKKIFSPTKNLAKFTIVDSDKPRKLNKINGGSHFKKDWMCPVSSFAEYVQLLVLSYAIDFSLGDPIANLSLDKLCGMMYT